MEWINVSDMLPLYDGIDVLVTVRSTADPNDYYTTVCEYGQVRDGELGFIIFDAYYQDTMELDNVVAWMPFPKPYKPN